MAEHSRRTFLARGSAGVAVVGAAAVVPSMVGGSVAEAETPTGPLHTKPFVVLVDDVKAGKLTVLVGERELTITDSKLAKQLAQAAARAAKS